MAHAADEVQTTLLVDTLVTNKVTLMRENSAERTMYNISLSVPGRKLDLTQRIPMEEGQTETNLTLSVKAQEVRHVSSLSLVGEAPELTMGLGGGDAVEVQVSRDDASEAALYVVEVVGATNTAFVVTYGDAGKEGVHFAAGQTTASFWVAANFSRLDVAQLRVVREEESTDRLLVQLPIRRTALATFENNFYICFIKKIAFGSRDVVVKNADGTETITKETIYKGRWNYLTNGLRNTIVVALCSVLLGAVLGFVVAVIRSTHDRHGRMKALNAVAKTYITIIRGTPMTVQLLIAYFIVFASVNNKILIAVLAFGFNSGAYVAEIIRAGIESIDAGQMEAARALGLSYGQGMRRIVLPQAFRNVLPALGNEFIVLLKDTSIASFIGLDDLARGGSIIRSQTYQAYIPFLAVAAIYLVIVMFFTKLLGRLESRLRVSNAH